MFFAKKNLIIDNDVLVNFVDYHLDYIDNVIAHLSINYTYIFIPGTILEEFLMKKGDKKRQKIIDRFFEKFQNFIKCPVNVSKNDIAQVSQIDEGEADAFMQISKLKSSDQYNFQEVTFLSNDRAAISFFKKQNLDVLEYRDLISKLKEIGIILPR